MSNKKNIEIEYLRAVAIGMTLLSHLPQLLPFHMDFMRALFSIIMPWTGVDLFFCISGYVVSKAYMEFLEQNRDRQQFWPAARIFWLRRVYRLLPTAWLWILIPLALSIVFNKYGSFGTWYENLKSFTAVATFTGNIANQYGAILGPNSVYWSLALEEQFYFIFPLFLLLVTKKAWQIKILLALIAAQFFLDRNPFGSSFSAMASSFRIDAIMWGVLIYHFTHSQTYQSFKPTALAGRPIRSLLVCGMLVYLLGAIPAQMIAMPISVALVAIVSGILVLMASYNTGFIHVPKPLSGIFEWVGSRSYGLYVIHVPAYHLSTEIWKRYAEASSVPFDSAMTLELLITAAFLLVALSELNYRLIETPLRRRGAQIASESMARMGQTKAVAAGQAS